MQTRLVVLAFAIALALPPVAGSLPPASPLASDPLLLAAQAKDVPGILAAIAGLPGVSPEQRAALDLMARAHAEPSLSNLVAIGEQQWVGHTLAAPELQVPGLRVALLGLFAAAGVAPDGAALAGLAQLEALPRDAQRALAALAWAETYALEQARAAFADLSHDELDALLAPVPDEALGAEVGWESLFLGLRAQLAAVEFAAPLLEGITQPATMTTCEVVFITTAAMDNVHTCFYLLAVDAGGNDAWLNNAGGTGPGDGHKPMAALALDLGGSDRYTPDVPDKIAGVVGGAVMGTAVLYDAGGSDLYQPTFAVWNTQGPIHAAVGGGSQRGLGVLVDKGMAPDTYDVRNPWYVGTQGGGRVGYGLLVDEGGSDTYFADLESAGAAQGGGDRGTGVLVDLGGDDTYTGVLDTRVGVEGGFAGGVALGRAALFDYAGNDVYRSMLMGGTMGSGGANGGSIGVNSVGLLVDLEGDDFYQGGGMMDSGVNGAAGVGGVGVLLDLAGNDVMLGMADMTGAANGASDNAVGVLVNVEGDDTYDALFCNPETGGINGGSFAGVGLLLDLGGFDLYRDRYEHHMPMDGELMCPMMMGMDSAGEAPWRADATEAARGVGHPVAVPTGFLVDDSNLVPGAVAGVPVPAPGVGAPDLGLPEGDDVVLLLDMLRMTDPEVLLMQAQGLGPRAAPTLPDYKPHGPVAIRSDWDFTAANGVVAGKGTLEDPYVIAGWAFAVPGLEASAALLLEGTTAHVVVRDNLFLDASGGVPSLALVGASNVVAERNVCVLGHECYHAAKGAMALFRNNLAMKAAFGFAVYDAGTFALLDHNDIVSNAEGVYFAGGSFVAQGNELLSNRDGIIGKNGAMYLRDNNFRLSGGKHFNMRNAVMISNTAADLCYNWWGHPAGPMVSGYEAMPIIMEPTPEGLVHSLDHAMMMMHPWGGEMIMAAPLPTCWAPWLTSPSQDAGWLL